MAEPPILYIAWQDPVSRAWYPIGRLTSVAAGAYRFVYLRGFLEAASRGHLEPLPGFPEIDRVYEASELFPFFKNRVMSPAREDYRDYLERLDLETGPATPLAILARSEGRRTTDSFEAFSHPLAAGTAELRIEFFLHGLRHVPESAQARARALTPGERLFLLPDPQNPEDPRAIAVRTADKHLLGYVPRYYCADLLAVLAARHPRRLEARSEPSDRSGVGPASPGPGPEDPSEPEARRERSDLSGVGPASPGPGPEDPMEVTVARVNLPPAPVQQQVLVRLRAPWTAPHGPLEHPEYQPIPAAADR